MAKISFINRSTGKKYTADTKRVEAIKKNTLLANKFTFEKEEEKPAEPKTTNSKTA